MEEIRIALFLAMFAVLGWYDFRTREMDDRLFLAFGGAGAALYVLDWQATDSYAVLLILCSASAAVMLWRLKIFGAGTADMFAIIAGAVIYPVYAGFVPTMLVVFICAITFSLTFTIGSNVLLNTFDATRGRLFNGMSDGKLRKCVAFFLVRRQRGFDRHAFLAENTVDGRRRLKLGRKSASQEFAKPSTWRYVEYVAPFVTFTAISAFFVVAAKYTYGW